MKTLARSRSHGTAFTLIELLVVVAVIAILAGLLFAVMPQISNKRMRAVARVELFEIQTAIEAYKAHYGVYPPDNPTSVYVTSLYFELVGTTNNATGYGTLDGRDSITLANVAKFGVSGFINSSASTKGTDDRPPAMAFLKELKRDRVGLTNGVQVLVCSEKATFPGSKENCAWRYNSSRPTNNVSSYDLWVDLYIDGKTNRISNWSKQPEFVR